MDKSHLEKAGFTLIELLVVVAIIGLLATVVLASLNSARGKGADAAIKANLSSARSQAELVYEFNNSSYAGVCTNGVVGATGIRGIGAQVAAAARAANSSYASPYYGPWTGDFTHGANPFSAVCNDGAAGWAAEVPLKTAGQFWCVDSNGNSKSTIGALITSAGGGASDFLCQ